MFYANIKTNDISNGPGVRTSLFVSGCRLKCKGCFNFKAWSFHYGNEFDDGVQNKIFESLIPEHITGLSILGGEPMEPENQEGLFPFLKAVKNRFPNKTIWLYTGYVVEDLALGGKKHTAFTDKILDTVDVIVDGPFKEERKQPGLNFHGSSNQRIIDLSLSSNKVKPIFAF